MVIVWGLLLMPIGVLVQTIAMLKTGVFPRWQGGLFLISLLFIGFPDGAEIINLTAGILMSVALIPYGLKLISSKTVLKK